MKNAHERTLHASIERVRMQIEALWSGTEADAFPRDEVRSWRRNPPGEAADALLPGVTRVGHGPFSFRFERWDGFVWRVRIESDGFRGWHGFELSEVAAGTRVAHTLEASLSGSARVVWPLLLAPVHDWCVEAIFDRMEIALATGRVPPLTERAKSPRVAATFRLLRAASLARRRLGGAARRVRQ